MKDKTTPVVTALEQLALAVDGVAATLDHRLRPAPAPGRPGARAYPHRPGSCAGWIALVPGLACQFTRTVPESYLRDGGLRCVCGAAVTIAEMDLEACECGRAFLHLGDVVRVAQGEAQQAAA